MATSYRQLQLFQPNSDSVMSSLKRALLYFNTEGIADGKRVPNSLGFIGTSTYSLFSNLLAPNILGSMSFNHICAALRTQFKPKPSIIAEGE